MTKTKTTNKAHRGSDNKTGRRVNASAIARECGLSRQRVSVLLREGHSPGSIIRRQKRKAEAAAGGDVQPLTTRPRKSESLLAARTRKERSLASLRELELRSKRGELVERDQVLAELATAIVWVRDSFLSLPSRLRDQCDRQSGAMIESLYDREIREVLKGFARKLEMDGAKAERGWELWREFLEWVKREKKEEDNGKT